MILSTLAACHAPLFGVGTFRASNSRAMAWADMPLAWFLGAGTSQSAGLPTAADITWDLKTRYYCAEENQRLSIHDVQNPAVREKISSFAEARNLPKSGSADEYAKYFELSFGSDKEAQRTYVRDTLAEENVSLAMGHRVLAALMASGTTRVVFTTNFDSVMEKAMARVAGKDLHAYHLEGSHTAVAALNNEEFPIYCKLDGDFRYERLKNLPDDLQCQAAELGKCVAIASTRFGHIARLAIYAKANPLVIDAPPAIRRAMPT